MTGATLDRDADLREGWTRSVAALFARYGDIDLAEESTTEAISAVSREDSSDAPLADRVVTAAFDAARSHILQGAAEDPRLRDLVPLTAESTTDTTADQRLGLVFACCHPALPDAARAALALRLLGGVSTTRIAATFGVPEATMNQRLARAKRRLSGQTRPLAVPQAPDLSGRLSCVMAVFHLIFTEGYLGPGGPGSPSGDIAAEAVGLSRLLLSLYPEEPEVRGLLALMLLIHARQDARLGTDGAFVPLSEQERHRWDHRAYDEGRFLLRQCQRLEQPGGYQVQAAIQALHMEGALAGRTDWQQILNLYDQLLMLDPSDAVALNRAVAVAEVEGPESALALVESLDVGSHLFHAVRAELLSRLERGEEAERAWTAAVSRARSQAEHALMLDHLEP